MPLSDTRGFDVPGYDVVELLGFGSGGEVWLARERSTGAPVALKRLRADADMAARDRLRREAAVLAGVDHPHVVRLRSVVGSGESLVLVLDLAGGGSLARLVATRGRLEPGEVVTIAVPLAQALAAVHARGLVHGDVSPANILFTVDGRPVLSDLGVSRLLGSPVADVGGTRGYLDPAVAAGGEPGPESDVHGLAAACLAALTGHPPYDDGGQRGAPAADDHPLLGVLEQALGGHPGDRPSAAELATAVFDAAAATPVRLLPGSYHGAAAEAAGDAVQPMTHRVGSGRVAAERGLRATDGPPRTGPRRRGRPGLHRVRVAGSAAGRGVTARWRSAVALLVCGTAVTMAVVAGIAWAGAGGEPGAARVGPPASPVTTSSATAPSATTRSATASPRPVRTVGSGGAASAGRTGTTPAGEAVSWPDTLEALDEARSRAFGRAEPAMLAVVYAPDAPALRRDRAVLSRLADAGLRARDLRLDTVSVGVRSRAGSRVRLLVDDVMPAYELVDRSGVVVAERPGRGRVRWTVTLREVRGQWRVYDVERG